MLRQPSQSSAVSSPTIAISGVDEGHQRDAVFLVLFLVVLVVYVRREAGDEQPQARVYLRRGQPDTRVLLHRLEHVVDELLDPRRPDVGRFQRFRARAEHRMPHAGDLQDRHDRLNKK